MRKAIALLVIPAIALVTLAAGCTSVEASEPTDPHETSVNKDPKDGWVDVWSDYGYAYKRCDGTTLVYRTRDVGGGLTAIPDSPECKK